MGEAWSLSVLKSSSQTRKWDIIEGTSLACTPLLIVGDSKLARPGTLFHSNQPTDIPYEAYGSLVSKAEELNYC